ncbi:MAG: HDOD domain-containing protein, partial [Myxococcales bacterium]|nr:HDOD domain-containing protein [Myxococcales bacterium]
VVAATIAQSFRNIPATRLRAHWTLAHLTALVSRSLAGERMPWLSRSAAWSSGLLHDIGELVRWQIDRESAETLAEYRAQHHCLPEEAEVAIETTPAPLYAAALCRVWNLPGPFEIVCRSHRTGVAPTTCRRDTVDIVRVVASASHASRIVLDRMNPAAEAESIARIEDILVTDRAGIDALLALAEALRPEAERAVSAHMMPLAV